MITDDLPFDYPDVTPANPAAVVKKCRHPREKRQLFEGGIACGSCGREIDPERIARGRRANRRGRAIQRRNMTEAGMDNLAGNLPGLDGKRGMFRGESKSGTVWPKTLYRFLQAIPAAAGQIPVLVVRQTPGRGQKAGAIAIVHLTDWYALHGEDGVAPADPLQLEETGQ